MIAVGAGTALLVNRSQAEPNSTGSGRTAPTHSPSAARVPTRSASATPSASSVATSSPSASGGIFPGTQQCGFSTADGHYQVYALAERVADCSQVSQALASFGVYWYPLSSGTIAQDQQNGVFQDLNSYCHLSATGNVELSIYATTHAANSSPDQLAKHVCVSEEAKGWNPHVSTQG